ncbi:hypothetical protein Ahy_B09g096986 isoform C [Arachis hypogaea]|uniref:Uncharacterized protein n=1 Tax=Arachis hypogaea TaxID=3818 RepID=A0A444XND4_ARAHY|nr:hypothetical protein Ahy_B09g096986 isoform C [Arachis hypogaea]
MLRMTGFLSGGQLLKSRQIKQQGWNPEMVILIWNFHSLGLDSLLQGNMHQGQKQHLWILRSVPSLKLMQKKLEREQKLLHKISR